MKIDYEKLNNGLDGLILMGIPFVIFLTGILIHEFILTTVSIIFLIWIGWLWKRSSAGSVNTTHACDMGMVFNQRKEESMEPKLIKSLENIESQSNVPLSYF